MRPDGGTGKLSDARIENAVRLARIQTRNARLRAQVERIIDCPHPDPETRAQLDNVLDGIAAAQAKEAHGGS